MPPFAEHWVGVQREEFKRLGVTGDWDDPYLTMDFHAEAVIADEFMKFVMNGALYLGSKPVMWSPVEKTALAEAEVEYHDHQSPNDLGEVPGGRPRAGRAGGRRERRDLDDDALDDPVEPRRRYSDRIAYGLYVVTAAAEDNWAQRATASACRRACRGGDERPRASRPSSGSATRSRLARLVLRHPLAESRRRSGTIDVPLLAGDFVTDDAGTGFVHTAPSHGADDYELFVRHGLVDRMTHNVLEDSSFAPTCRSSPACRSSTPRARKARPTRGHRQAVEAGALLARGRMTHSYPHSWRSKAPVIYRNTPQWFVAIDQPLDDGMDTYGRSIRERALTSIDRLVQWTPVSGRNRLYSMIEARPDWVLSRQRAWGVPLTCFVRRQPDGTRRDPARPGGQRPDRGGLRARGRRRLVRGRRQGAVPRQRPPARRLGEGHRHPRRLVRFRLDPCLRAARPARRHLAGLVYLEGTDQHRGWFHSSMLQACGTRGRAPYEAVVTHGFTLDENGMKMSKSLGNTMAPQDVIRQYGADILRLWVAQTDYSVDQRIGPEILKGTADSYRRLRNTLRFLLGALDGFDEAERVRAAEMPELERWVLHRLAELDAVVRDGYAAYDFQGVFQPLFQFCTVDLSAFYFDIRKDALYCDAATSPRRRAARTVLDALFHRLVTWLAPMLPFTMEEVWLERFPGRRARCTCVDSRDAGRLARPGAGGEAGADPPRAPRRDRRARGRAAREADRREPRGGARGPRRRPGPARGAALGRLRRRLHHLRHHPDRRPGPCGRLRARRGPGRRRGPRLAEGEKCARCWKILPDVGTHAHPGVCSRCDAALP